MNSTTKNVLKYFIEFLIVGFGVFLGIYVSDWQSQKKTNEDKEKSINYIFEELSENKENLQKTIEYHELIKVGIDSIMKSLSEKDLLKPYFSNKKFRHQNIKGWTGVGLASFDDTAFEGAKISGVIQEMEIELIQSISKVYKSQNVNMDFGKSVLGKLMDSNSDTKIVDFVGTLELLTSDVLNHEKHLFNQLKETIAEIKDHLGKRNF